ncbi:MAG TPA: nucleoside triphosphate pyrophosphohydrolase [Candidatus Binatia bacterium]|nr:nucleoside triphosphate pyrophosphohydrolase [Candidatus Binatia bacterium]
MVRCAREGIHVKLVRDRIPDLIKQKGELPVTHVATDAEFRHALAEKLLEESREFHTNPSAEELADVLEVAYALAAFHGGKDAVEATRAKKADERGGFSKKLILH